MPKAKPTEVILHRISFADKEREALEAVVMGKTIESVSKSASMLVTGVGAGFMAYAGYWTLQAVFNFAGDAENWMKSKWELIKDATAKDPNPNPTDSITVNDDGEKEYKPDKLGIFFPFNQYISWLP
jgi:hypothetical protein